MNWEFLVTGVIGILTGGGITWLFRIKEDKVLKPTKEKKYKLYHFIVGFLIALIFGLINSCDIS